uniref:Uncharacterized protein LOC105042072 n=1 Tax=Elaeis guineensis var. tenera TaxID=51953 RepID=A0A8N4EXU0_ELAGV|nr:uncharacterized protein LOC105042072 [Elaeis guineensis]
MVIPEKETVIAVDDGGCAWTAPIVPSVAPSVAVAAGFVAVGESPERFIFWLGREAYAPPAISRRRRRRSAPPAFLRLGISRRDRDLPVLAEHRTSRRRPRVIRAPPLPLSRRSSGCKDVDDVIILETMYMADAAEDDLSDSMWGFIRMVSQVLWVLNW